VLPFQKANKVVCIVVTDSAQANFNGGPLRIHADMGRKGRAGMLGLEAWPWPRCQFLAASVSASSRWPRPRVCGLDLEWNEAKAEAQRPEKLF